MRVLPIRYKKSIWIIKAIVYFFKISGLAPFSIQMKTVSNDSELIGSSTGAFIVSKFGLAYNIFLLIVHGITIRYMMKTITLDSILFYAIRIVLISQSIFAAYFIICWLAIKQKTVVSIIERLLEVDVMLSGLKHCSSNKITSLTWVVHIIINGCLWVVVWKPVTIEMTSVIVFKWVLSNQLQLISYWFIIQYAIVIGLVSKELATLNDNLIKFQEYQNNFSTSTSLLDYRYPNHWKQVATLKRLYKIRVTISELCKDLINLFSLPILIAIAKCFTSIIGSCFYVSNYMIEHNSFEDFDRIDVVGLIFISIYSAYFLFSNVEETVKEADLTGHIVHKLLLRTTTNGVRSELERFSIWLLHENLVFTAYDFFSIDFTLLYSMLGAISTYLVILIQFSYPNNEEVYTNSSREAEQAREMIPN